MVGEDEAVPPMLEVDDEKPIEDVEELLLELLWVGLPDVDNEEEERAKLEVKPDDDKVLEEEDGVDVNVLEVRVLEEAVWKRQ